jgi:hypothetical protein
MKLSDLLPTPTRVIDVMAWHGHYRWRPYFSALYWARLDAMAAESARALKGMGEALSRIAFPGAK